MAGNGYDWAAVPEAAVEEEAQFEPSDQGGLQWLGLRHPELGGQAVQS